jgi:hypothetical protein
MTTLQQLSENTGLSLSKLKIIASEKFGTAKDLTEEQIEELVSILQDASEIASLPPAQRKAELLEIKQLNQTTGNQIETTIKTVGLTNLKKQRAVLETFVVQTLGETKQIVDATAAYITNYTTSIIGDAYVQAAKNLHAVNQEFNVKSFEQTLAKIESGEVTSVERYSNIDWDLLQIELDMM